MNDKTVFKKSGNIASRAIAQDTVLLPIRGSSGEMNCIYTLNKAAAWVWENLDGKKTVSDIERLAEQDFSAGPGGAGRKLRALLSDFEKIEAIYAEKT